MIFENGIMSGYIGPPSGTKANGTFSYAPNYQLIFSNGIISNHKYRLEQRANGWFSNRSESYSFYITDGQVSNWNTWLDGSYAWAGVYSIENDTEDCSLCANSSQGYFSQYSKNGASSATDNHWKTGVENLTYFQTGPNDYPLYQRDGILYLYGQASWNDYELLSSNNYTTASILYKYNVETNELIDTYYNVRIYYRETITTSNSTVNNSLSNSNYYWKYDLPDGTTLYIWNNTFYTSFLPSSTVTDKSLLYFYVYCDTIYQDSTKLTTYGKKYQFYFTYDRRLHHIIQYTGSNSTNSTQILGAGHVIRIKGLHSNVSGSLIESMVFCNGYLTNTTCYTL